MNINYTSLGKPKMLFFTSANSDHIKAMEKGLKNLGLTIQEEQNLLEEYAIDGRPPEKINEVKIRLKKLLETKNFIVSKIKEAKKKMIFQNNISEDIAKQQSSTHNKTSFPKKETKIIDKSKSEINQHLTEAKFSSNEKLPTTEIKPKKVSTSKKQLASSKNNNANSTSLNYLQIYYYIYGNKGKY